MAESAFRPGNPTGTVSYRENVPAVARATRVLEAIVEAPRPQSLAQLSRAVESVPSSLLAVLTTLRAAGLVSRSESDGLYSPGPGLIAMGARAARWFEPARLFQSLGPSLARSTGESALLWLPFADGFVLVGVEEGTRSVRYAPSPGLVLSRASLRETNLARQDVPTVLTAEPEADVRMVAIPLAPDEPGAFARPALLALAGPANRVAVERLADVLRDVVKDSTNGAATLAGRTPGWEQGARIDPSELQTFLGLGLVATLSYIAEDGYPATVPLWYVWDGAAFWLAPHSQADWALQVQREPRVSLAISESRPPLRRVLARGTVEAVEDRGGARWRWVAADLESRYPAFDAMRRQSGESGRRGTVLRLSPRHLIAWRGLLHHPRAMTSDGEGGDARASRVG